MGKESEKLKFGNESVEGGKRSRASDEGAMVNVESSLLQEKGLARHFIKAQFLWRCISHEQIRAVHSLLVHKGYGSRFSQCVPLPTIWKYTD